MGRLCWTLVCLGLACGACSGNGRSPSLQIGQVEQSVLESDGRVRISITRTDDLAQNARLLFATRNGSALAGSDYEKTTGELLWAPEDAAEKQLEILLIDGAQHEDDEFFFVDLVVEGGALQGAQGVTQQALRITPPDLKLGGSSISVQIKVQDDDLPPVEGAIIQLRTALYEEGVDGARFTVFVSQRGGEDVVGVDYLVSDGTAQEGLHYAPTVGRLNWRPGEPEEQSFIIPLLEEGRADAERKTIEVMLQNPTGGMILGEGRLSLTIPAPGQRPPMAAFTASALLGEAPLIVDFDASGSQASTSSASEATLVAYRWDFGDGQRDEGVQLSHTFAAPAVYAVTLTVEDSLGLTASETQTVVVESPQNRVPVVNAGENQVVLDANLDGQETVRLDGTESFDEDGMIVEHRWFEGPELLAEGASPSVELPVGDHLLKLIAKDDQGEEASAHVLISVASMPASPAVRINAGGEATIDVQGNSWFADQPYSVDVSWGYINPLKGPFGQIDRREAEPEIDIGGTDEEDIFATERWGMERYRFDVPNGVYDLVLSFAETWSGANGPDLRVFDVVIEGDVVIPALDIFVQAGFQQALNVPITGAVVRDGQLDIEFVPVIQQAEINGVSVFFSSPLWVSRTLSRTINSGENDVEVHAGGTAVNSSDLELTVDPSRGEEGQRIGLRFVNVQIPAGAQIVGAYIQFTADEVSGGPTNLSIQAEIAGSAASFVNGPELADRVLSQASVNWRPSAWAMVQERGSGQRTPNLAALLQEVVDGAEWSAGSALALVISGSGHRAAVSYDGEPEGAPRLFVLYEP